MMKMRFFFLVLIFALTSVGCAGLAGQETDVVPSAPTSAPTSAPLDAATQMPATAVPVATETLPPSAESAASKLPVIEPAPAWSNQVWINSEEPLSLPDLRGKVVLLEFWTFG